MTKTSNRQRNPFYALLLIVGVVFCLSSWLVFLVALRERGSSVAEESSELMLFFERHGTTVLLVELALLAVCAFTAMAIDRYRDRRSEAEELEQPDDDEHRVNGD